jgi:NAD(P)-dependent dehydrogenase (short-subunit alcohol dehydrogenase family)
VHFFYHLLCAECAQRNLEKRQQRVDLAGRRALVTGGRVKIGYQAALKFLRDEAEVLVTTRFAGDAAVRYRSEPDYDEWRERLQIVPLDFRNVPAVLAFIDELNRRDAVLDILINNAAQTVRRPFEDAHGHGLPAGHLLANMRGVSDVSPVDALPAALRDWTPVPADPIDQREQNSWTLRLAEVAPVEFAEVLVVNTLAPFLLTSQLKPLFLKSSFADRYIVNVTGADGLFGSRAKTSQHPHINMTKAALNMMTRTAAADYAATGIYMNSVDTGWITHEGGFSKRERMRSAGFAPPLDEVDGAARIYDPIVGGIRGEPVSGKLLKNYLPAAW